MNTMSLSTHWSRSSAWARGLAIAALAAGGWALSGLTTQAHARGDVYWSVGVNSPGVSVGVSNAPPVVYYPPPVYSYGRPVVVYEEPVVVHRPYRYVRPVVVAPAPVYYHPGRGHGNRWGHRRGHRHDRDWDDDRHDNRWDDDDRRGYRRH